MSVIAMAQPVPHSAFKREFAWDESRHAEYTLPRRPSDNERIVLPSIRQAVPEIQTRLPPLDPGSRTHSSSGSPVGGFRCSSLPTPDYIHSPNQHKRRRSSIGEERDERASQIPRLYASPHKEREYQYPSLNNQGISPTLSLRSATESWASPPGTSPFPPQSSTFAPVLRESASAENLDRLAHRPMLPRLPGMDMDRSPMIVQRARGRSSDEGYGENLRHSMGRPLDSPGPSQYRSASFYGYHHPSRVQSLSLGSVQMYDRTPFSPTGYASPYSDFMRVNELGMNHNGESKQRKRRGNLPKETTDKLRAWFMAHLTHPYPTEDEKQKLMRRTGLQMSKCSLACRLLHVD